MTKTRDLANLADLNFDSGTMVVDKVNDRVGIGATLPTQLLDLESANGGRIAFTDTGSQRYSIGNSGNSFTIYDETDSREALSIDGAGSVTIETDDNLTQLTLSSTHTNAAEGPRLDLRRNSTSPADNDAIGTIRFLGQDSAASNTVFAEIQTLVQDVTAGTTDANLQLLVRRNGTLTEGLSMSASDTVFNEAGNDIDFRIESNLNSNAFFVNGGTSNVGINRAPAYELDVGPSNNLNAEIRVIAGTDSGADAVLRLQTLATAGTRDSAIYFGDSASSSVGRIVYGHANDDMRFWTNNAERLRLSSAGLSFDEGSNYLNSYEEGTWSPEVRTSGGVVLSATTSGRFTKIGRLVHVNGDLTNINTTGGTSTHQIRVYDLPFTVDEDLTFGSCVSSVVTFQSNRTQVTPRANSSDFIEFMANGSALGFTNIDVGDLSSGVSDLNFSITYYTNQ